MIQIALLPAVFVGFGGVFSQKVPLSVKLFSLFSVLIIVCQFLPIDGTWPSQNIKGEPHLQFFSPVPGKSLESGLFFVTILGFGLHVTQLKSATQIRLLNFIFIGAIINIALVLLQLSYSARFGTYDVFPYAISIGIFQNENHLSALLVAIIPLLTFKFIGESDRGYFYYPALLVLLVVLYAVGSRAGMFLAAATAIFSIFWFKLGNRFQGKTLLLLAICLPFAAILIWYLGIADFYMQDDRWTMTKNTWRAIQDHWMFGSGLGSFETVYSSYEFVEQIGVQYTHHAHNDVLELLLETGLVGALLMIAVLVMIVRRFRHSLFTQACAFSIVVIILHSLLDYPMRTMAIGIVVFYLVTIVVSKKEQSTRRRKTNSPSGD